MNDSTNEKKYVPSLPKNLQKQIKTRNIITACLIIISLIIILVGQATLPFETIIVFIVLLLLVIFAALAHHIYVLFLVQKRQLALNRLYTLYKKCYNESKIEHCRTSFDIEKIKLVATQMGLDFSGYNIADVYEEARSIYLETEKQKQEQVALEAEKERLAKKRNEIDKRCPYYFARKYTGREKRLMILRKELAKSQEQIQFTQTAQKIGLKQETNPYVMGGLASGLVGGAAGLAIAMDTERENTEIRKSNAEWKNTVGIPASMMEARAQRYSNDLLAEITTAERKYVSTSFSSKSLLDKIVFSKAKCEVSENKTLFADIKMKLTDPPVLSENVTGVVDGVVIGEIRDRNNKTIGQIYFVLPLYGLSSETTVTGCSDEKQDIENGNYTIKITDANLWAMEK